MKEIEINAKVRENLGKKASRALRKLELVPCVLYGTEKNIHFSASEKEFKKLVYTPNLYYAKLMLDGKEYKAILKDIQFHPVSDKIIHIDFQNIIENKPITVPVPVKVEGFAKGVQEGGKLYVDAHRLKVKGFFKDIVEEIVVNVTELTIGKSIKVADLKLNNLVVVEPSNKTVASVRITRIAKEAEVAAETVETAEGAAAPVEGESVPAEGTAVPADGVAATAPALAPAAKGKERR